MIIGIGIDLVDINRLKHMMSGHAGDRFLERVLTPGERLLAVNRQGRLAEFVAGRFAAKEAVVKAFGSGIGGVTGFQDIEVIPDERGRPICRLSDDAILRLGFTPSNLRLHLSITHTETTAAAYAIAELVDSPQ